LQYPHPPFGHLLPEREKELSSLALVGSLDQAGSQHEEGWGEGLKPLADDYICYSFLSNYNSTINWNIA